MATENLEYLDESGLNRTAVNVLAKIAETKAQIEEELNSLSYAKPNGIYPEMTVGAVIGADETSQWAQRESTGTDSAIVRSVQGAAVVWGQMLPEISRVDYGESGIPNATVVDGVLTGTVTGNYSSIYKSIAFADNHKYMQFVDVKVDSGYDMTLRFMRNGSPRGNVPIGGNGSFQRCASSFTAETASSGNNMILVQAGTFTEQFNVSVKNWQLFDLTAMFGAGNEPQSVAELERMYPASYYPYSEPTLKPVQIAGIRSTDAQGNALDSVEWTAQTLRAAGSVADMLYADHVDVRAGVYTFTGSETLQIDNWQPTEDTYAVGFPLAMIDASWPTNTDIISNVRMAELETIPYGSMYSGAKVGLCLAPKPQANAYSLFVRVPKTLAADKNTLMAWLAGKTIFYELATPTTTPISPALPMTYHVQQGGSESIIVPDGEISAAPIITIAEPVNMNTELALIWTAIEALQGSRQALQSDVRNDMQEITADLTQIDVTKEVQQTYENREVSE